MNPKWLRESWSEQPANDESNTWSCNLCDVQTFCVQRTTLYGKRQKHIAACRPDRCKEVQTLGKRLIPVAAFDTRRRRLARFGPVPLVIKDFPRWCRILLTQRKWPQMTRADKTAAFISQQGTGHRSRNEAGWRQAEAQEMGHDLLFWATRNHLPK